jgi:acyl carrier protein
LFRYPAANHTGMFMSQNLTRLAECFRNALALPATADVEQLAYQDAHQWDSIAHMRLVAAIENAFDVMFSTEQILDMSDYRKACDILAQHGITL